MNIYTLNIGQGQFVVVTGQKEAFVIDTYVPGEKEQDVVFVKAVLSQILSGKNLKGLIVTGFDSDHFNEKGIRIVLNKYRSEWIMYPKYFKETTNASNCFKAIKEAEKNNEIQKISVSLDKNDFRFYTKLSDEFTFEIFSPHVDDMNSSNNCSLVCKIKEKATGASYLVTGDTENQRWDSIVKYFGNSIKADVLDAPHHGSKNGITEDAMKHIKPHTVLISAGVKNQYGHPNIEAVNLFKKYASEVHKTNIGDGKSLHTTTNGKSLVTKTF